MLGKMKKKQKKKHCTITAYARCNNCNENGDNDLSGMKVGCRLLLDPILSSLSQWGGVEDWGKGKWGVFWEMRREAMEEGEARWRRAAPSRLLLNTYNHPEGENGPRAAGVFDTWCSYSSVPSLSLHGKFLHSSDLTASDAEINKEIKKIDLPLQFSTQETGRKVGGWGGGGT